MHSQGDTHVAYVGVGSNLADPARQVRAAIAALGRLSASQVVGASSLYRSAPIGNRDRQPDYINAVACVMTALAAQQLLEGLLAIEVQQGRVRGERNAARTLDLDLLLYDDAMIDMPGLTVPHPRMHERAFVLRPLAELAPATTIPGRGPLSALLPAVADQRVERLG